MLVGYTLFQFQQFLERKATVKEKNQANWKLFTNEHAVMLDQGIPQDIAEYITILDDGDAANLLKMYYKWVTFFDLF